MIILTGGQKGGDGKSTTCINLAVHLIKKKFDIVIVDTNYPQNSSCVFAMNRDRANIVPRIPVIQKLDENIALDLRDLARKYEHVLVDCGGYDSVGFRSGLLVADVLITPIQATDFSVDTIPIVNGIVKDARINNPKLKAYLFINNAPTNPALIKKEVAPAIEKIATLKLEYQFCNQVIHNRVVFRDSIALGCGVLEMNDQKAISELDILYKEMFHEQI